MKRIIIVEGLRSSNFVEKTYEEAMNNIRNEVVEAVNDNHRVACIPSHLRMEFIQSDIYYSLIDRLIDVSLEQGEIEEYALGAEIKKAVRVFYNCYA